MSKIIYNGSMTCGELVVTGQPTFTLCPIVPTTSSTNQAVSKTYADAIPTAYKSTLNNWTNTNSFSSGCTLGENADLSGNSIVDCSGIDCAINTTLIVNNTSRTTDIRGNIKPSTLV
jgi:hypothetical protein